jgi:hypothetical protein
MPVLEQLVQELELQELLRQELMLLQEFEQREQELVQELLEL